MKKLFRSCLSLIVPALFVGSPLFAQQGPQLQWVKTYQSPYLDEGMKCAVDSAGYLYVVGIVSPSSSMTTFNWITLKYNAATGDTVWTRIYTPPVNGTYNLAMGCAVDNTGNLFVAGGRSGTSGPGLFVIKYNSGTGDTIWTRPLSVAGTGTMATDCRLDGSSLYLTGIIGSTGANNDYFTIKCSASTGDTTWTRRYDGPSNGRDEAYGCAPDGSGNLYVMGYSFNGSSFNLATVKYNSNGDTLWTRRSVDTLDTITNVNGGCACDNAGNCYVAGMLGIQKASGKRYGELIKYGPSGDALWVKRFAVSTNYDSFMSCAVDTSGNVYATGTSYGTSDDGLAVRYNATTGDTIGTYRYDGSMNLGDYLIGCTVDRNDNLYAVGMTNSFTAADIVVMKLHAPAAGVLKNPARANAPALLRVSCNPGNPLAVIRYRLSSSSHVTMKISDQLGRQRAVLVDGTVSAGDHQVAWNMAKFPAGVYVCRLTSDKFDMTEKIILEK
jgi:hypothetical protein